MQFAQMNVQLYQKNKNGEKVPTTVAIVYNTSVISREEVIKLLETGHIIHDERVVITTPIAATTLLYGVYPPIQGRVS